MTKPTVEANYGGVECSSYLPGHNLHWIPVLRKWVDEPRLEMTIRHLKDNAFEITCEGITTTLYNHNPRAIINAINNNKKFKKVGEQNAITVETETGHAWFYFATEPFLDCQTPNPKYYDRYRDIDKEIKRLEGVLEIMQFDRDIESTKVMIERAKHIKHLQQTNAHEKLRTLSGYESVCSCGLLLDNIRRVDEAVGHINF